MPTMINRAKLQKAAASTTDVVMEDLRKYQLLNSCLLDIKYMLRAQFEAGAAEGIRLERARMKAVQLNQHDKEYGV